MKKRCALLCLLLVFPFAFAFSAAAETVEGRKITLALSFGERTGIYTGGWENGLPNGMGKFSSENEDGDKWYYEGEFVDGHLHGEGRCVWDNGQEMAGHFENDALNGYGKEYQDGRLVYEGDWVNGIYHGQGKAYNKDGQLVYEGELVDGHCSGYGKGYSDGDSYEGYWLNDTFHGQGKLYRDGYLAFEGEYVKGKMSGQGKVYFKDGQLSYEGELVDGCCSGYGKAYQDGQLVYEGNWADNKMHGQGTLYQNGELFYKGIFADGKPAEQNAGTNNNANRIVTIVFVTFISTALFIFIIALIVSVAARRRREAARAQTASIPACVREAPARGPSAPKPAPGRINLNTALQQELEALPGVGAVLAKRALEMRAQCVFLSAQDFNQRLGLAPHFAAQIEKLAFAGPDPSQQQPPWENKGRVVDI